MPTRVVILQRRELQQDKYLQDLVVKYGLGSKDKATRLLLDYVMASTNEATIFKVKRCRNCNS
uniref:Uncharacterized protein n=1 Tax=Physcomitrium patens TaxID=3218 RepID=A0A2K1J6W5_PHYPA|nr:hypothetical protein PHYPA_020375 [Physcomitrium patens]